MLSLGKLAPGQQQYYLDTVARGAEEYYTGAKEAPGQWIGAASRHLGLAGEVDADVLHHVLEHRDPRTGVPLTRTQGAARVPGFDATFSAPKSVSLLFALGEPDIADAVRDAHDAAVERALAILEAEAARARRGKAGVEQIVADGFAGAAFRHRTSRAGDPQLHTHVVIANLVHAESDGRWSALDARPLYTWAKTVGYLYEAELRAQLTRRLGVEWTAPRNGIADIAGVPDHVLRAFSRRRQDIEQHLAEAGEHTPRAAQVAAYATRAAKTAEALSERTITEWHERARELGFDQRAIGELLNRSRGLDASAPATEEIEVLFAALASPTGLTAKRSTFGRREVIEAISEHAGPGVDIGRITDLSDAFLASPHVVALGRSPQLRRSDVIRRRDGRSIATRVDQERWTTPELLAVEAELVERAIQRCHERVGVADRSVVDAALKERPSLTREQESLVRRITSSGAGVEVVEGAAGTGKTHALAAARQAWEASGHRVLGCSLAARAAAGLEQGSGIPSQTIHRLLRALDRRQEDALRPGDVVVVDEAAMVGTRTLARLLEHANTASAKVVLVGDHRQLPAIDAGGALEGLAHRLGATSLQDNQRQAARWERRALARLRAGVTDRAIAAYQAHGRIRIAPTTDEARTRLVDDWLEARETGKRAMMLAARKVDVDELNDRARTRLQERGSLSTDEFVIGARPFATGDEVIATRNAYDLGVLNGTTGTVAAVDRGGGSVTIRTRDDQLLELPHSYIAVGDLTHAYALTLHKAQGVTVDAAFVLGTTGLDREHAYSALSRGVEGNWLYLAQDAPRAEDRHAPELEAHPIDRLEVALERSSADSLALELDHDLGLGF